MTKAPGNQVVDREAELKAQIEAQQKMLGKITTSSKFISFKGGNIIIDKKAIAGAKTEVVVLAFMAERTYFPGDFDPDTRQSPLCYAYSDISGADEDLMAPHKEAKEKQAETCAECHWNEWNTAKKGRGKACRESVRVALLPNQPDLKKAEIWHARIPITSVQNFKDFANGILGYDKPIFSVVAQLKVIPDDKSFFKVLWDALKDAPEKFGGLIETKAKQAQAGIAFPYPNFDDDEKPKTAKINAKLTKQRKS